MTVMVENRYDQFSDDSDSSFSPANDAVVNRDWCELVGLYTTCEVSDRNHERIRPLLNELGTDDLLMLNAQLYMHGVCDMMPSSQRTVTRNSWDYSMPRLGARVEIARTRLDRIAGREKGIQQKMFDELVAGSEKLPIKEQQVQKVADLLNLRTLYRYETPSQGKQGYLMAEPLLNGELETAQERIELLKKVIQADVLLLPHIVYDGFATNEEARAALELAGTGPYAQAKLSLKMPDLFGAEQKMELASTLTLAQIAQIQQYDAAWFGGLKLDDMIAQKLEGMLTEAALPLERLWVLNRFNYAFGNTHPYAAIRQRALADYLAEMRDADDPVLVAIRSGKFDQLNGSVDSIIRNSSSLKDLPYLDACSLIHLADNEESDEYSDKVSDVSVVLRRQLPYAQLVAQCGAVIGTSNELDEKKVDEIDGLLQAISKHPEASAHDIMANAPNFARFLEEMKRQLATNFDDNDPMFCNANRCAAMLIDAVEDPELRALIISRCSDWSLSALIGSVYGGSVLDRKFLQGLTAEEAVSLMEKTDDGARRALIAYLAGAKGGNGRSDILKLAEEKGVDIANLQVTSRVAGVVVGPNAPEWRRECAGELTEQKVVLIDWIIHNYGPEIAVKMYEFLGLGFSDEQAGPSPHYLKLCGEVMGGENDQLTEFVKSLRPLMHSMTEAEAVMIRGLHQRFVDEGRADCNTPAMWSTKALAEAKRKLGPSQYAKLERQRDAFSAAYSNTMRAWTMSAVSGVPEHEIDGLVKEYKQFTGYAKDGIPAFGYLSPRTVLTFKRYLPRLRALSASDLVVGQTLPVDAIMTSGDIDSTLTILEQSVAEFSSDLPRSKRYAKIAAKLMIESNSIDVREDDDAHGVVRLHDGTLKPLKYMIKEEYMRAAEESLEVALNVATVERVAAMRRNMAVANELIDNGEIYHIPNHFLVHSTSRCVNILQTANMAGECLGVSSGLRTDSYPGFVDMHEVTGDYAPISAQEFIDLSLFRGSVKIVYYPGQAEPENSPGDYGALPHQLAFTAIPNTQIACLIDTGENEGELEQIKIAEVEAGLYIPIVNREGRLVYSPQQFEKSLREAKPYHTLDDIAVTNTIFASELWEHNDPGGVSSIAGHMNDVADAVRRMTEKLGISPERAIVAQVAAKLHDIGKIGDGSQEVSNVAAAGEVLRKVFDITPEQKREILMLIRNDELLGEVLKSFELGIDADAKGTLPRYAQYKLDQFNSIYTTEEMRQLAICLYQADVFSKDPALWRDWRVPEKLEYLGMSVYADIATTV